MTTSTLDSQVKGSTLLFANGSLATFDTSVTKRYFERDGAQVLELDNVAVFRSGTFRDSMGYQHTYSEFHIEQFVVNFNHLKTSGILPDVPVRKGHPSFAQSSMDGLIGYFSSLRAEKRTSTSDGKEYTYLVGKYEILDKGAQEKIDSGLWRNRSAEVGVYVDNNEAKYAPTFMGVAYVDIPAVEGLNGFTKSLPSGNTSYMMEEEMSGLITPPAPGTQTEAPTPFAFNIGGSATSDYAAVQAYVSGLEAKVAGFEQKMAQHAQAEKDREEAERTAFVNQLQADGKVLATQGESTLALALSLNPDQYSSWSAMFGTMPTNPLLQQYGNQDGEAGAQSMPTPQEDVDMGVIRRLVYANVSEEAIKRSQEYGRLIAADPTFQISTATGQ